MKINRYILKTFILPLSIVAAACTADKEQPEQPDGNVPVELRGIATRAPGDVYNYTNLNFYAEGVNSSGNRAEYIPQRAITIPDLNETDPKKVVFSGDVPYYPIGQNEIYFYAYSGPKSGSGDNMTISLTSGTAPANDAVVSNYGVRKESTGDPGTVSPEGEGTPGASNKQPEYMQFRHVMTKLKVNIEPVYDPETPGEMEKYVEKVKLKLNDVRTTGRYRIKAKAPVENQESSAEVADNMSSANYQMTVTGVKEGKSGLFYLVPNGKKLTETKFAELIIDDYTATTDDLDKLVITVDPSAQGTSPDGWMVPGYAYELTLKITRLRIVEAVLVQKPWNQVELTNEGVGYEPKKVELDLQNYKNEGEGLITKLVLNTNGGKMYIGGNVDSGTDTKMNFITLPAPGDAVKSVDLYTDQGLLLTTEAIAYGDSPEPDADKKISVKLSECGMLPENPELPYNGDTNPYSVTTVVQFLNINKDDTGVHFKQRSDLDMHDLVNPGDALSAAIDKLKTGARYDGNGKRIINLTLESSGLFKENNGVIEDVHLVFGRITANGVGYAGSICGINNGTIIGCKNQLAIGGCDGEYAGGIAGLNNGQIFACLNTGNIFADVNTVKLGGIAGLNESTGTIVASVSTGHMDRASDNIAGICHREGTGAVKNSYWLTGTAAANIGGKETGVAGGGDTNISEVVDVSPDRMLNGITGDEPESYRIVNRLNAAIDAITPAWDYKFIIDEEATSVAWPVPVKK